MVCHTVLSWGRKEGCYTCKNPYYRMHLIQAFIWITLQIEKTQKTSHICITYSLTFLFPFEKRSACQSPSHYSSIVSSHNLKQKVHIKSIALHWSYGFNAYFCDELFTPHSSSETDSGDREDVEGRGDREIKKKSCLNLLTLSYASLWNCRWIHR